MHHLLRALALALFIVWPHAVPAAPLLAVASAQVQAGDSFDITVAIQGVDAATGLGAWQFDLAFDPTILRANSLVEGPFLAAWGTTLFGAGVIDNGSGLISLVTDAFVDLPPLPAGDGVLAVISFTALADGVSALTLDHVFLDGSDAVAAPLAGQVQVGVTELPEPASAGLALLALAGLLAGPRGRPVQRTAELSHLENPS